MTKNVDTKHRAVLKRLAAIEKRLTTIERKIAGAGTRCRSHRDYVRHARRGILPRP